MENEREQAGKSRELMTRIQNDMEAKPRFDIYLNEIDFLTDEQLAYICQCLNIESDKSWDHDHYLIMLRRWFYRNEYIPIQVDSEFPVFPEGWLSELNDEELVPIMDRSGVKKLPKESLIELCKVIGIDWTDKSVKEMFGEIMACFDQKIASMFIQSKCSM